MTLMRLIKGRDSYLKFITQFILLLAIDLALFHGIIRHCGCSRLALLSRNAKTNHFMVLQNYLLQISYSWKTLGHFSN